jgi:hypothetical protein
MVNTNMFLSSLQYTATLTVSRCSPENCLSTQLPIDRSSDSRNRHETLWTTAAAGPPTLIAWTKPTTTTWREREKTPAVLPQRRHPPDENPYWETTQRSEAVSQQIYCLALAEALSTRPPLFQPTLRRRAMVNREQQHWKWLHDELRITERWRKGRNQRSSAFCNKHNPLRVVDDSYRRQKPTIGSYVSGNVHEWDLLRWTSPNLFIQSKNKHVPIRMPHKRRTPYNCKRKIRKHTQSKERLAATQNCQQSRFPPRIFLSGLVTPIHLTSGTNYYLCNANAVYT